MAPHILSPPPPPPLPPTSPPPLAPAAALGVSPALGHESFDDVFNMALYGDLCAPYTPGQDIMDYLLSNDDDADVVDWYIGSWMYSHLTSSPPVVEEEAVEPPQPVKRKRLSHPRGSWAESVWYTKYVTSDRYLDPICAPLDAKKFRNRFRLPLSAFRAFVVKAKEKNGFRALGSQML